MEICTSSYPQPVHPKKGFDKHSSGQIAKWKANTGFEEKGPFKDESRENKCGIKKKKMWLNEGKWTTSRTVESSLLQETRKF